MYSQTLRHFFSSILALTQNAAWERTIALWIISKFQVRNCKVIFIDRLYLSSHLPPCLCLFALAVIITKVARWMVLSAHNGGTTWNRPVNVAGWHCPDVTVMVIISERRRPVCNNSDVCWHLHKWAESSEAIVKHFDQILLSFIIDWEKWIHQHRLINCAALICKNTVYTPWLIYCTAPSSVEEITNCVKLGHNLWTFTSMHSFNNK